MAADPLFGCSSCGEDFASLRLFDVHRVGKFPQTGPADYLDRLRAGLVDGSDWRPEFGRRCLDADELEEKGLARDARGRWTDPVAVQRARESFQDAPCEVQQTILRAA